MRHHSKKRKLHRVKRQRTALLRSLARSLVLKGGITTTEAKAKELRPYIERLVTTAKANSIASRRSVRSTLASAEATKVLHESIAPKYSSRPGGYTRIVKLGRVGKRVGEMAKIEFV